MSTGEHMAGKTNNPGGRPRTEYLPPWNARNVFKIWQLPKADRILYDLEQSGGNLARFLQKVCPLVPHREALLVAILDELEKPENAEHHRRWVELIDRGDRARLILAEQSVLDSLLPHPEDDAEQGPGVGRIKKDKGALPDMKALQFLLQKHIPEKFARHRGKKADDGEISEGQKELLATLRSMNQGGERVD